MVIATHLKGLVPGCSDLTNAVLSFGRMGVQLFFVVSAFTLYISWCNRKSERHRIKNFYIRRYFRIAPLYYFGIVLYCIWGTFTHYLGNGNIQRPEQFTAPSVLTNLLLLHGFYPPGYNNIVPGGWSIATEFLFYLVFPFLINLIQNKNPWIWPFFLLTYLTSLFSVHLLLNSHGFRMELGDFAFHSIANQMPVFLIALTGAKWIQSGRSEVNPFVIITICVACFSSLFVLWNSSHSVIMSTIPGIAAIGFACLLSIASKIDERIYETLAKPICWIGSISFSMYIWHFIIVDICHRALSLNILQWKEVSLCIVYMLVVAATAGISVFSEKWIEATGIKMGKNLIAVKPSSISE